MSKKIIKKTSNNRKINKVFSPEEMTALSNISSIINELMQMGGNDNNSSIVEEELEDNSNVVSNPPARNDQTPSDNTEENEEKEVKMIVKNLDLKLQKILKGLETTPSESATASDDAEERMDEPMTDLSEENLNAVAKTIALLLAGKTAVKKSAPKRTALEQILDRIVSVQKSTQEGLDELSVAFGHILKGMGIAEQLEVTKSESDKQVREAQVSKSQNEEMMKFLKQIVDVSKSANNTEETKVSKSSPNSIVRKNLGTREVLTALVGGGSRVRNNS